MSNETHPAPEMAATLREALDQMSDIRNQQNTLQEEHDRLRSDMEDLVDTATATGHALGMLQSLEERVTAARRNTSHGFYVQGSDASLLEFAVRIVITGLAEGWVRAQCPPAGGRIPIVSGPHFEDPADLVNMIAALHHTLSGVVDGSIATDAPMVSETLDLAEQVLEAFEDPDSDEADGAE